jgi:hypothetical protein
VITHSDPSGRAYRRYFVERASAIGRSQHHDGAIAHERQKHALSVTRKLRLLTGPGSHAGGLREERQYEKCVHACPSPSDVIW